MNLGGILKMEKKKVIDVYKEMLQRANVMRESKDKDFQFAGNELFFWVAELEKTKEVNP